MDEGPSGIGTVVDIDTVESSPVGNTAKVQSRQTATRNLLSLKCHSDACGHAVGVVVGAELFAIVVGVQGNAVAQQNCGAGADEQTVAANLRAVDRKTVAGAIREAGNDRVGLIAEFVLPGKAEFRSYDHVTHFPIVGRFHPKCRALGFGVLTGEFQWRKRAAFGKATKADVAILKIRRRTNAQTALLPVVAGGDQNVEAAAIGVSASAAEVRR